MQTPLDALIARARRAPTWAAEAALAVIVGVPTGMDAWWNEPGTTQADAVTYALAAVSILCVVVRRLAPLIVSLAAGLALSGLYLRGHHGELLNLPVMITLYTVAVEGDRRRTVLVGAIAVAWSGVLGFTSDDPLGARGGSPVLEMLIPVVPLLLGEMVRTRRELAAHTVAEHEREAARRVEAERTRIARELHDVLAHTLAAVNVQTAAAAASLDSRPDVARESLAQARASTKAALGELRATLHLLRDGDSAPAPTLDRLDDVVGVARAAGIHVTAHIDVPPELPEGIRLAAYRIVQEAVTNTIRHSDAHNVAISIAARGDTLHVEVLDDGHTPPRADRGQSSGLGLIGMRERAHALGGRLDHGPVHGGGYRVAVQLPANREQP